MKKNRFKTLKKYKYMTLKKVAGRKTIHLLNNENKPRAHIYAEYVVHNLNLFSPPYIVQIFK